MKIVLSIALFILCYLIVSQTFTQLPPILTALLGSLMVMFGLLLMVKKKPVKGSVYEQESTEYTPSKFYKFFGLFILLAILFGLFFIGPSAAKLGMRYLSSVEEVGGEGGGINNDGKDEKKSEDLEEDSTDFSVGNTEQQEMDIPKRGGPSFEKIPKVRIIPTDEESAELMRGRRHYVITKSFDKFDGYSSWALTTPHLKSLAPDSEGSIQLTSEKNLQQIRYRVIHSKEKKLVHSLPGLTSIKLPFLRSLGAKSYYLPELPEGEQGEWEYDCVSTPIFLDDIPLADRRSLKVSYSSNYLKENNLVSDLSYRITDSVEPLKDKSNLFTQLDGIREILRQGSTYSLDIENPRGLHPIDNFLHFEKKGYCLHFATAGVLMARELGIPARISFGYAGGTYFREHNMWVFYSDNAHSWLEVKLDGYGWVVVDTTPEVGVQTDMAVAGTDPEPFVIAPLKGDTKKMKVEDFSAAMQQVYSQVKGVLIVIAVLLLILIVVGTLHKRGSSKRRKVQYSSDESSDYRERPYMAIYRKMSNNNGVPMFYGDTLRKHIEWLESEGKAPDFTDHLLSYHYGTVYMDRKQKNTLEKDLIRRIKKWKI